MKRSKSLAGVICALVLGGSMFAVVVPAFADSDEESSAGSQVTMTYKFKKQKFVGAVSSNNAKCLGDRVVKLFKAKNGKLAGKTRTNDAGGWSIAADKNSGKYYSKVIASEVTLKTGQDKYGRAWVHVLNCGGAKSDVESASR